MTYFVYDGKVTYTEQCETDVTVVRDDVSLISDADWLLMVEEAGSEAALMEQLGVTDAREEIKKV